jgi:hypothetical protein
VRAGYLVEGKENGGSGNAMFRRDVDDDLINDIQSIFSKVESIILTD